MVLPNPFATRILILDDDSDDIQLFDEAVKLAAPWADFFSSMQPQKIDEILVEYRPDVLFLDINMHQLNGFACLDQIRKSEQFEKLPVVMYSSSNYIKHIDASYDLGATLYFQKPAVFSELVESLKVILSMKWHRPSFIRAQYYKNGQFSPFQLD